MATIFASVFSSRNTPKNPEAASSPLVTRSALSGRKLWGKTLSARNPEKTVRFDPMPRGLLNDTDISLSTRSLSVKSPDATTGPKRSHAKRTPDSSPSHDLDQGVEDVEYTFIRFVDYRWKEDSMDIQVEWEGGGITWEPEDQLHQDAPDALLEYWKSQGGRPVNPNDPDLFDIHAIRKHSRDRKRLLVEWVGFGPKDATWVSRAAVEETAPEFVAQYWKTMQHARPKRNRRRRA